MLQKTVLALALILAPISARAEAVKGVVVFDKGCRSRLIIETAMGYILAEWYGGNTPSKGDVLVGELDGYGFKDVYNLTADSSSRLYIDDFMLSRTRVIQRLRDKCS